MKILITGSNGNVGTALKKRLANSKYNVLWMERGEKGVYGDLRDYGSLLNATKDVDLVVHLAGAIKRDNKTLKKVNTQGTKNLINACEKNKVKKILFVSTLDVKFDTNYGTSKLNAEKVIEKSKLKYTILRPSLIYGKNFTTGISSLIRILEKSPIIPVIGKGDNLYQPLYVEDLVMLIEEIINKNKFNNKTFFVCGKEVISMNDLIDLICLNIKKKRIKIHIPLLICKILKIFPFIDIELENFTLDKIEDNKEIKKDFNFNPIGIKEEIKRMN